MLRRLATYPVNADNVLSIGGGGIVFVAMIYTTIADVVHASERATLFLQLTAVFLGSEMLAGPLGGAMLLWSPWFPLLTSLGLILVGNLILTVFPETVHVHDGKKPGFRPGYSDDLDDDARDSGSSGHAGTRTAALRRGFRQARSGLAELWQFVVRNRRVASLVVALTFVILGRFVGELMLQYSTARYGWSWSHAAAVLTVRNAGCLVALLVVLPLGGRVLVRRFGLTASAKDLWLGRVSGVVLILGSLTIGAAAVGSMFVLGLVEFALGSGMSALVRSLLNSLVEEHHVGTVNSLVGFAEVVGMIIAGPLLAKSLSVGLQLGGAWIGLPFAVAALLFVVPTVILFTFRLPEGRRSSLTSVAGHHA
jgi:MFS family permease